tara:strand:- start:544 stop:666 length:123 start_codon:yes stop_codon:yes gene_type:complete
LKNSINVNHGRIDSIYDKYADNEISQLEYDDLKKQLSAKD